MSVTLDKGDTAGYDFTTFDANGFSGDPTTVTLTIEDPDGLKVDHIWPTTGSIRVSLGVFHYQEVVQKSGWWFWHWKGVGNIDTAEEGTFYVAPSNFP